jgi:uncharacterized membrane protein
MDGTMVNPLLLAIVVFFAFYFLDRLSNLRREVDGIKLRLEDLSVPAPHAVSRLLDTRREPRPAPTAAPAPPPPSPAPPPVIPREARTGWALNAFDAPSVHPPEQPVQPQPSAPPPPVLSSPAQAWDMETFIQNGWLARLGVAAIVLCSAFLLQYAFARIGAGARVLIGGAIGLSLYALGQWFLARPKYRMFAQAVSSGGIVVFFLSIYAAHNLYQLIGYWAAFALLTVPTLLASVLAVRTDTQGVAIACLLGAFAVPALLQSGQGAPGGGGLLRLYAYLGFLNVWTVALTRMKPWHSLPILALAATWTQFFLADPLTATGWAVEAFALLFLVMSVVMGAQTLGVSTSDAAETAEPAQASLPLGVWIILAGCVAYLVASASILSGFGILGWPAFMPTALLVALLAAGLSLTLGEQSPEHRLGRQALGLFAGAALLVSLGLSTADAPRIPLDQFPAAFGFAVGTFLLFLGVAVYQSRREGAELPAAALLASACVVQAFMTARALEGVWLLGMPAAVPWMVLSGWIAAAALAIVRPGVVVTTTAAVSAQALTLVAMLMTFPIDSPGLFSRGGWNVPAAALLAAEFALVSLTWLVLRGRTRPAAFRADLTAPYVNAGAFFVLLWQTAGMVSVGGVTVAAAVAVLMAVWHAAVWTSLARDEDLLHRLTWFGLAATFVTIAVPLQFREGYVTTLAWATEAALLVWMGLKVREPRTRAIGYAVLCLAAGKALTMDLLRPLPDFQFLLNARTLSGAAVIATACVAAALLSRGRAAQTEEEAPVPAFLVAAANVLALLFVSVDLWQLATRLWPSEGDGAAQLALSLFWTLYALAGVVTGIWRRIRVVRFFAMGLLYLSILKVFLWDLSGLEQPYRIVSFMTLGVILLAVSLLYARFEERLKDAADLSAGG